MKKIHTENAPAAIGPYSQAVVSGRLVFTSGQDCHQSCQRGSGSSWN